MVVLCDEAQVESISVRLEIVLILTQDRCSVCAERTIGSEIILDAPDGTLIRTRWGLMADLLMRDRYELDWWKKMMFTV
jgi:hypothetical protein